jgi:hypothetical protein
MAMMMDMDHGSWIMDHGRMDNDNDEHNKKAQERERETKEWWLLLCRAAKCSSSKPQWDRKGTAVWLGLVQKVKTNPSPARKTSLRQPPRYTRPRLCNTPPLLLSAVLIATEQTDGTR